LKVIGLKTLIGPHGPAVAAKAQSFTAGDHSIYFFLQLAVILVACRVFGWAGQRFLAQPQVVGEVIAGVVLEPSLFGLAFPDAQKLLFPENTKNMLYVGAQLGVGLYMFLVGTTLQIEHVKSKARSAMSVSLAGIVVPFLVAWGAPSSVTAK
jgi:Kef-type K+ transport system membrane component KefB